MLQQAIDFRDESEALYQLLAPLDDSELTANSQFKHWTPNDVIGHLHLWNWAADLSLRDSGAFQTWMTELVSEIQTGNLRQYESRWLDGRAGAGLIREWREFYLAMTDRFAQADPKQRVKWAGPDMSVRSSITARLMETWAHGQAIYDLLGVERQDADRVRNIAQLGVNTFAWTFRNRGEDPPGDTPWVRLTAPSGDIWAWNEGNTRDLVGGNATEFCQVVTQTRNIADTGLTTSGEIATRWMAIAQCFAGPPEDPPAPGSRHRSVSDPGQS